MVRKLIPVNLSAPVLFSALHLHFP